VRGERLAQFFTPPAVAELTWKLSLALLGGGRFNRVIDPAAGQGVFLDVGLSNGWLDSDGAYGIELDPHLRRTGVAASARFHTGDGLCGSFAGVRAGSFDLVIGNPPFGSAGRILPRQALERLERLGDSRFCVGSRRATCRPLAKRQIEHLFVDRALQLVRAGGMISLILPEGFVANARYQAIRNWVAERADLMAVVGLPPSTFRRPGLNALTSIVVLRRRLDGERQGRRPAVFMAGRDVSGGADTGRAAGDTEVQRLSKAVGTQLSKERANGTTADSLFVSWDDVARKRWDVTYWRGVVSKSLSSVSRFAENDLGDFIQHLTYGPIITGEPTPEHVTGGIPVIRQADFVETGLCLGQVLRVEPDSAHDPGRSRVQAGDLLLPRSGVGSLGRNRMAVYMNTRAANVGCFVDLIRLVGINPFYVWMLLRSEPGWGQIRSLINGVGTPNINFSEIRSLRVPLIPMYEQDIVEARYRETVWPHHRRGRGQPASRERAWRNFQRIRSDLEAYLAGSSTTLLC